MRHVHLLRSGTCTVNAQKTHTQQTVGLAARAEQMAAQIAAVWLVEKRSAASNNPSSEAARSGDVGSLGWRLLFTLVAALVHFGGGFGADF